MVFIQMRFTVADYKTWREAFDSNDGFRRAGGWTGTGQVLRDVADPNTITLVMEWQDAEKAKAFLNDPALAERMKASGVTGAPAVRTISTLA